MRVNSVDLEGLELTSVCTPEPAGMLHGSNREHAASRRSMAIMGSYAALWSIPPVPCTLFLSWCAGAMQRDGSSAC